MKRHSRVMFFLFGCISAGMCFLFMEGVVSLSLSKILIHPNSILPLLKLPVFASRIHKDRMKPLRRSYIADLVICEEESTVRTSRTGRER